MKEKTEETCHTGGVSARLCAKYFLSGGGWFSFSILIISFLVTQTLFPGTDYWLSLWIKAEQIRNSYSVNQNSSLYLSWVDRIDNRTSIYIFSGLVGGLVVFSMISGITFFFLTLSSSSALHSRMFRAVIRSPLHFFEQIPIGIGLNTNCQCLIYMIFPMKTQNH